MAVSYKDDKDQDERLNPGGQARDLYRQEQQAGSDYKDNLDDHPITAGDASGVSGDLSGGRKDNKSNIDDAKNSEQHTPWKDKTTPGGSEKGKKQSLRGRLQKKGPIALILSLLSAGGISFISFPALLPIDFATKAENSMGTISTSSTPHWMQKMRFKVGNQDACLKNPNGIRCKNATIPEKSLKKYEKDGFKIESVKIPPPEGQTTNPDGSTKKDRYVIKSLTFPDGTKVTTGAAFANHMNTNVDARSRVYGVVNPGRIAYAGKNFSEKVLKKFGLAKNKVTISGKDKEAIARSFDRAAGLPEDAPKAAEDSRVKLEDNIKSKAGAAAGKGANIAGMICGAYSTSRIAIALVKAKTAIQYVAFGYLFIKLADQIRAGDADSTTVATAMTVLTRVATSGENAGKTATDSAGYKAIAYGDRSKLSSGMQGILLNGNPALIKIDNSLAAIKGLFGGGNIHTGCRISNNPAAGFALSTALCAAGGAASGTVVPILGTAIGGVGGVIACVAIGAASGFVSGILTGYLVDQIMSAAVNYFSKTSLSFDTPSVDAGNAITIGAGLLFGTAGLANGMKLGTKSEVTAFNKFAYEVTQKNEEVARYDARDTPFDVANQYSFMGQIVRQTGMVAGGGNVFTSAISSIGSILSNARLSFFSATASAASMPVPMKDETFGDCADNDLADKGIACDAVGEPRTVQSVREMTMPVGENLDYMIGNGYIDEAGTVNEEKDYFKFLKYCTGQDESTPGSSTLEIDDDDYDWPEKKCQQDNDMMANFRTYTSRFNLEEDEETQYDAVNGASNQTPTTTTPGMADIAGDDYANGGCSQYNAFCTKQCVDFVLFRLIKHGVLPGPRHMGNGKDVVTTLGGLGFKVDTTPAVHSVMSTSHTSHPSLGHTAMVSKVNSDGSIVVEEYNYANPLAYSTRTITAAQMKADEMTFAHTEVKYK